MEGNRLPYDFIRFDYKERLTDRYLTTHLHRFEMFSKPVALAVLIEIISPWHPSSEFGQKIINSLVKEFTHSQAQSFLSRFELSLKKTNRVLQNALDSVKTEISVVVLLIEEDQVHVSGIGSVKLGLIRNNKLASIINGKLEDSPTFMAVTSGDMKVGDWVILANKSFYSIISNTEISTFNETEIELIVDKIVATNGNADSTAAGLLFRYLPEGEPQAQTIFWDSQKPNKQLSAINWQPKVKLSIDHTKLKVFSQKLFHSLGTVFKLIIEKIKTLVKKWSKKSPISSVDNSSPLPAARIANVTNKYQTSRLPKFKLNLKGKIPIIIFLILLILASSYLYSNVKGNNRAPEVVVTLTSEIKADSSTDLYQSLIKNFTSSKYQSLTDAEKIELSEFLKNSNIYLFDLPTATTQTANPIVATDVSDSVVSIIDDKGQSWLYRDSLLVQLGQTQAIPAPLTISMFNSDKIVISDKAGNVWLINSTPEQPVALTVPAALSSNPKLTSIYKANLYFISQTDQSAYRIPDFNDNLDSASVYLQGGKLNLTDAVDLAVNGSLLAVSSAGQFQDFTRGAIGKVAGKLPTIETNVKIAADEKSPRIFISTGRFIYIYDLAGALQKTLFLTTEKSVSDISVDPTNLSQLWVSLEKELYSIKFE